MYALPVDARLFAMAQVVSLAMSPVNDTFLSASLDETVRLWDLRTNVCQGLLRTRGGRSAVAFDPQGLIFACATSNNALKLYDCRSFDKGPFGSFQVAYPHVLEWTHLKFSPDGKLVLLAASENLVFLADSFTGQVLQTFSSHVNETGCVLEASFTPDSQYVFSGSEDGAIHVWRTAGPAEPVHVFHAHAAPVGCVAWNPKYAMFASACTNLCMWLPQEELPTA
jgi:COMPASS component SWD2